MNNKKKILIIPSWYPTEANPISGSFIKEQAELMKDMYNIKVLYGTSEYIGYRRYYYRKIKKSFTGGTKQHGRNEGASNLQVIDCKFPFVPAFKEERNLEIMLEAFSAEVECLIASDWKPDLIHAHCAVHAGIIAEYLGRKYKIPVIITEHQVFLLHAYSNFLQRSIIQSLESVDIVAAVSYHQMRCILMHSIDCNPVVIGNYVNEDHYTLKQRNNVGVFRILTVTYPGLIKDSETFFKAISSVVKKGHQDISVTIIGNNSFNDLKRANSEVFQELAERYSVTKYCNFILYVNRDEMPEQYHSHDVFVSTSVAETFGIAICEAILTGMPVVTTKSGGVDDTVTKANGIKVDIKDAEAIADSLISIKMKNFRFDPLSARNSMVEKYGSTAFRAKLRDIYEQAIQ